MSDMDKWVADLGRVPGKIVAGARLELERASLAEKRVMAENFKGGPRYRGLPNAVTYDVRGLSAEIGIDKRRRQGALGNIIAFGTAAQGPTVNHTAGFEQVARDMEADIADRLAGLL